MYGKRRSLSSVGDALVEGLGDVEGALVREGEVEERPRVVQQRLSVHRI
jgi:hypothetical protein